MHEVQAQESTATWRMARDAPGSPWQKFEMAAFGRGEGRIKARKMVSLLEKEKTKTKTKHTSKHKIFIIMLPTLFQEGPWVPYKAFQAVVAEGSVSFFFIFQYVIDGYFCKKQ